MSNVEGQLTLDTSQAVSGAQTLIQALGSVGQSGLAMFASIQEVGTGLEELGGHILSAVGSTVTAATQIQTAQAQLTAQSYNFGESLGQNQAQTKGLTSELMSMATSIKQPISSIQSLASAVAFAGYSGQQIPILTKEFAEFGAVTGSSASLAVKYVTQIAQQTRTPISQMGNLLSSIYAVSKETAGGVPNLLSMTDRMSGLSLVTGMTAQQFVALAATSANFDARLRGGAYGALQRYSSTMSAAVGNDKTQQAKQFFMVFGDGNAKAGEQLVKTNSAFDNFTTFLNKVGQQTQQGAFNLLQNVGFAGAGESNISQGFYELAQNQKNAKNTQFYMQAANQGWQQGTDVQTAYLAIQSTTASQMIGLRDTITQLTNSIGSSLLPALNTGAHIMQMFAGAASAVPAPILETVTGVSALIAVLAIAGGAIGKLGAGLAIIRGGFGRVGGVFAPTKTPGQPGGAAGDTVKSASTQEFTAALQANTAALERNTAAVETRDAAVVGSASEDEASAAAITANTGAVVENTAAKEANVAAEGARVAATEAGTAAVEEGTAVSGGLAGALGVVGIALVAATALWAGYTAAVNHFKNEGTSAANSFSKGLDVSTTSAESLQGGIDKTTSKIANLKKQVDAANKHPGMGDSLLQGLGNVLGPGLSLIGENPLVNLGKSVDTGALKGQIGQLQATVNGYKATMASATTVENQFNASVDPSQMVTLDQVLATAASNMIDLASGGKEAQQAVLQLLQTSATQAAAQQTAENQQALNTLGQATMSLAQDQNSLVSSSDQVAEAQIAVGEASRALANYNAQVAESENQVAEAQLGEQQAALAVQQAQLQEQQASQQLAIASFAVADASAKVRDAQAQQQLAQVALLQAQQAAREASQQQNLQLASSTLSLAQAQQQQKSSADALTAAQWALYKTGADYAVQYQQALNSVADTTLSLQQAQIGAANAQWQLTYLQQEGASSRDIQIAQLALAQANQQVTDTQTSLTAAQQQAKQLPTDHTIAMKQAQDQLAASQLAVQQSALSEQQAQLALLNTQQDAANNTTIITANANLKQAQDKIAESAYQEQQAQIALNTIQSGSIQLAYQQTQLQVSAATDKTRDASWQVVAAQTSLNNLQDGAIQLNYKKATDQLTSATLQNAEAQERVDSDMAILNGSQMTVSQQAQDLANLLINSGNPALQDMGRAMLADIPAMDAYQKMLGVTADQAYAAATAVQTVNQIIQTKTGPVNLGTVGTYGGGVPVGAAGAFLTKPTLMVAGEAGDELLLPLNNPQRMIELLRQAGLIDSSGIPTPTLGFGRASGAPPATYVAPNAGTSTTHNYYLNAITQPADPQDIVDAFVWQNNLVGAG